MMWGCVLMLMLMRLGVLSVFFAAGDGMVRILRERNLAPIPTVVVRRRGLGSTGTRLERNRGFYDFGYKCRLARTVTASSWTLYLRN